jgi:hypothetical protein
MAGLAHSSHLDHGVCVCVAWLPPVSYPSRAPGGAQCSDTTVSSASSSAPPRCEALHREFDPPAHPESSQKLQELHPTAATPFQLCGAAAADHRGDCPHISSPVEFGHVDGTRSICTGRGAQTPWGADWCQHGALGGEGQGRLTAHVTVTGIISAGVAATRGGPACGWSTQQWRDCATVGCARRVPGHRGSRDHTGDGCHWGWARTVGVQQVRQASTHQRG